MKVVCNDAKSLTLLCKIPIWSLFGFSGHKVSVIALTWNKRELPSKL